MSRDYVLLAEQRAAEVDLKNRCAAATRLCRVAFRVCVCSLR
jgi:hypothetical protein